MRLDGKQNSSLMWKQSDIKLRKFTKETFLFEDFFLQVTAKKTNEKIQIKNLLFCLSLGQLDFVPEILFFADPHVSLSKTIKIKVMAVALNIRLLEYLIFRQFWFASCRKQLHYVKICLSIYEWQNWQK